MICKTKDEELTQVPERHDERAGPINRMTSRTLGLREMGLVEEAGKRKCRVTGRNAIAESRAHAVRASKMATVFPKVLQQWELLQAADVNRSGLKHHCCAAGGGATLAVNGMHILLPTFPLPSSNIIRIAAFKGRSSVVVVPVQADTSC
jgi:hypothetical protein